MKLLLDLFSPTLMAFLPRLLSLSENTKLNLKSFIFCLNGIFFLIFSYILSNIALYYYLGTMWDEIYVFSALSMLSLAVGLVSFILASLLKNKPKFPVGRISHALPLTSDRKIPQSLHELTSVASLKTLPLFFLVGVLASYLAHSKSK